MLKIKIEKRETKSAIDKWLQSWIRLQIRPRLERGLVSNIINAKANLGLGLASIKWTDQLAEELHKPVIKKFRKRSVYVKGIDMIFCGRFGRYASFLEIQ